MKPLHHWVALAATLTLAACDAVPTGPEQPLRSPQKPRHDTGTECVWIGYGAGYLCPGIVALASPYTPPDPPFGGAYYSSPCYNIEFVCTYDPNFWVATGGYSESGGAPQGFPPELYDALNAHERQLVWWHPLEGVRAYVAAHDAEQWAQLQTSEGAHNGMQDALRHAMWNCLMTHSIGADAAKMFADAHEESSANALETAMDLHNNEVGREVAQIPNTTCGTVVMDAWDQGRLETLE
jgi:uncharacterized protein DUF6973